MRSAIAILYTTKDLHPLLWLSWCVLGRWASRFSSSLVALSLGGYVCVAVILSLFPFTFRFISQVFLFFFCSLLFFALYSTNDTAAEVQLCAQWFALFCLAPPLLSVSLCLTRSSVHKVAVHLSARREGSYRQAGERTPKVQGRAGQPNRRTQVRLMPCCLSLVLSVRALPGVCTTS